MGKHASRGEVSRGRGALGARWRCKAACAALQCGAVCTQYKQQLVRCCGTSRQCYVSCHGEGMHGAKHDGQHLCAAAQAHRARSSDRQAPACEADAVQEVGQEAGVCVGLTVSVQMVLEVAGLRVLAVMWPDASADSHRVRPVSVTEGTCGTAEG